MFVATCNRERSEEAGRSKKNDYEYHYFCNYTIFSFKVRGIDAEIEEQSSNVKNDKEQSPRKEEEGNSEGNKLFH